MIINHYKLISIAVLFFLIAHSASRTFYMIDLTSPVTWVVTFIALSLFVTATLRFPQKVIVIIIASVVIALKYSSPDFFYSSASWNYPMIGASNFLQRPLSNYFGGESSLSHNFNLIEYILGYLAQSLELKDLVQYLHFYRIINSFIIVAIIFFVPWLYKIDKFKLIIFVAVLIEGSLSPYVKHNFGLLFAIIFIYTNTRYFASGKTLYALISILAFTLMCFSVETYPLFLLGMIALKAVFTDEFKKQYLFYVCILTFVTIASFRILYGFGNGHTFSSDLSLNYSYIRNFVYGHDLKFLFGLILYILLLIVAFNSSFKFNFDPMFIKLYFVAGLLGLAASLVFAELSALTAVFHRSIYLIVLLMVLTIKFDEFNKIYVYLFTIIFFASAAVNQTHHSYKFLEKNNDFFYNAVINPYSGDLLTFNFLLRAQAIIEPGSRVFLDRDFAGHSVLNFWFGARPVVIKEHLISNITQEDYRTAEETENLLLHSRDLATIKKLEIDFIISKSETFCKDSFYTDVLLRLDGWVLCSLKS